MTKAVIRSTVKSSGWTVTRTTPCSRLIPTFMHVVPGPDLVDLLRGRVGSRSTIVLRTVELKRDSDSIPPVVFAVLSHRGVMLRSCAIQAPGSTPWGGVDPGGGGRQKEKPNIV